MNGDEPLLHRLGIRLPINQAPALLLASELAAAVTSIRPFTRPDRRRCAA